MKIAPNLAQIKAQINAAEQQFQRQTGSVNLLAVSKTRTLNEVTTAIDAGQHHFGENYCQEAIEKIESINNPAVVWHFIGPIQSNKTTQIATHFDWVHAVDRIKIARRLNEARPAHKPPLNICIQVNISDEPSKSGITTKELTDFINDLKCFERLKLRGLMALPAPTSKFEEQRKSFAALHKCLEQARSFIPELDTLSMGTSQDMDAAIAEGATIVRIGTAIFGPRNASH